MARHIRFRTRRCASPKAGLRQKWDEWQVVDCRRVIARFDTLEQAKRKYPGLPFFDPFASRANPEFEQIREILDL